MLLTLSTACPSYVSVGGEGVGTLREIENDLLGLLDVQKEAVISTPRGQVVESAV